MKSTNLAKSCFCACTKHQLNTWSPYLRTTTHHKLHSIITPALLDQPARICMRHASSSERFRGSDSHRRRQTPSSEKDADEAKDEANDSSNQAGQNKTDTAGNSSNRVVDNDNDENMRKTIEQHYEDQLKHFSFFKHLGIPAIFGCSIAFLYYVGQTRQKRYTERLQQVEFVPELPVVDPLTPYGSRFTTTSRDDTQSSNNVLYINPEDTDETQRRGGYYEADKKSPIRRT